MSSGNTIGVSHLASLVIFFFLFLEKRNCKSADCHLESLYHCRRFIPRQPFTPESHRLHHHNPHLRSSSSSFRDVMYCSYKVGKFAFGKLPSFPKRQFFSLQCFFLVNLLGRGREIKAKTKLVSFSVQLFC